MNLRNVSSALLRPKVHALKRRGLRLLNWAGRGLPWRFSLLGVQMGFADFDAFRNTIVYQPRVLPQARFTTVRKRRPPAITLSSAPRLLKGGGLISISGGIARRNGAVYTSAGDLVISRNNLYEFAPDRLLATSPTLLPRIDVAGEPVAMLSTSEFNYFHWLHDVLPKLHLLAVSGYHEISVYINVVNDLQRQTLALLGVRTDRVINAAHHEFIATTKLVCPHFAGEVGTSRILSSESRRGSQEITMGNVNACVDVAPWTCSFLRECFLDHRKTETAQTSRIYISRRDAWKKRGVKAEEEFRERMRAHGFETIVLTGMKFTDQVDTFRNAEVVLAPHGAGLANIVFCRAGTKCIELFSPTYVSDLYAVLSQVVGAEYYYLVGNGERRWKNRRSNEELEVDLDELDELFKLAGLE
jgi:capsular polysaccharide biosynthesis protein